MVAADQGFADVIEALVKAGANINELTTVSA